MSTDATPRYTKLWCDRCQEKQPMKQITIKQSKRLFTLFPMLLSMFGSISFFIALATMNLFAWIFSMTAFISMVILAGLGESRVKTEGVYWKCIVCGSLYPCSI